MRSLIFLFKEFWYGLSQNRYSHFTCFAQVTVSLLVLGIFFVMLVGAAVMWEKVGDQMKVHVFLKDDMSALSKTNMEDELKDIPGVTAVQYRSKDEALKVFSQQNKAIRLTDIGIDNPLPDSYVVQVDNPSNIKSVAESIETLNGVLNVRYGEELVSRYLQVLGILVLICIATIALLVLFTYISINNIIGLSIYSRRAEIRIMQLVGATWWFIRWPFLFEGLFLGVTGAVVALIVITLLLSVLGEALRLSELSMALPSLGIGDSTIWIGLAVLLLGLGALVGFFGSLRMVNGFLHKEVEIQLAAMRTRRAVG